MEGAFTVRDCMTPAGDVANTGSTLVIMDSRKEGLAASAYKREGRCPEPHRETQTDSNPVWPHWKMSYDMDDPCLEAGTTLTKLRTRWLRARRV